MFSLLNKNFPALSLKRKFGSIGIDFGTEKINMVQMSLMNSTYNIKDAASIPYPENREHTLSNPLILRRIIKETLREHKFSNHNVVASVPPNIIKLSLLNYQCDSESSVDNAIFHAIKNNFDDVLPESVIDYIPIRPKVIEQKDRSALVAIADQKIITQYLEALRIAGLNVKALEISPVAIKRLLTKIEDEKHNASKILCINFGTRNSFVTVLWGGQLLLDKELDIGLNSVIETISEELEISEMEALTLIQNNGFPNQSDNNHNHEFFNKDIKDSIAQILKPLFLRFSREIKKVIIYTAAETQGGAIDTAYILGSFARWPNFDRYIANYINVPVKTINPFFGFQENNMELNLDQLEPISGIAVATGLALNNL